MSVAPGCFDQGNRQPNMWLALFALVVLALLPAVARAGAGGKSMKVVLRYDDFSNRTAIDFDRELIDALRTRGLSATFGVIPFERERVEGEPYYAFPGKVVPLAPEKGDLLAEAVRDGTVEVALHGYVHQEVAPERPWSEFAGVTRDDQYRKIAEGKDLLERALNTGIDVFIPPFNTFDDTTVRVTEELGFRIFSAGGLNAPESPSTLSFLPSTCQIAELREAVLSAREAREAAPIIVALCHPHDLVEVNPQTGVLTMGQFAELLDWLAAQEDVQIRALSEVVAETGRPFEPDHYREYCARRPDKSNHLLPGVLGAGCSKVSFYPTRETLRAIQRRVRLRLATVYGTIVAVACVAAYLLLLWFPRLAAPAAYAALLALIGLVAYVGRNYQLYFLGASAVAGVFGGCLGAWARYLGFGR
jgi:peptidoglycan/xylan/chitin deacetylase (PgdA/CDA1 family)